MGVRNDNAEIPCCGNDLVCILRLCWSRDWERVVRSVRVIEKGVWHVY